MCKFKLFSIAAAALMMVACSTEDLTQQTQTKTGEMQFTATIAAPGSGATTRTAYTESGTDINVAWKVGDEIALIHNGVKDVATVKTINADGSATINGYVTGANGEDVDLYYPAARMISNGQGGYEFNPEIEGKKLTQDGTLKYIQDNLDFREGAGQFSVDGGEVTLKASVAMAAENAVWKLTLQDDAETPAALSATQVKVKVGGEVQASTAALSTAASTVYLAVPNMAEVDVTIEATAGENTYAYTKEGVTLAPSTYYQSTVNMSMVKTIDLSELQGDCEAKNGYTLTGTLTGNYKISIAAGATVTLDGVTINGVDDSDYSWAGITCLGDATIILKDGTTNTVIGFENSYPGIYVPGDAGNPANNKTLTIKGTGSLTANCHDKNGWAAGIGGNSDEACGNIVIAGGTINATGGYSGAGIGSGRNTSCGAITISGGTVTATGGKDAAGIGSGYYGKCGDITITSGVTKVTATKGANAPNSIGVGYSGSCGTVTIGGKEGVITSSPYTYPLTYPVALSAVTSDYIGSVVTTDGNVYATVAAAEAASKTAVAMIAYVGSETGLALALADESSSKMTWNTAKSTCSGKTPTITGGTWKLASKDEWKQMINAVGGYAALRDGFSSVGGSNLQSGEYWSSTEVNANLAWVVNFVDGSWGGTSKNSAYYVRACLAF